MPLTRAEINRRHKARHQISQVPVDRATYELLRAHALAEKHTSMRAAIAALIQTHNQRVQGEKS